MKLVSRALLSAVAVAAVLGFCGSAEAAIVTLGPNLSTATFEPVSCGAKCALIDTSVTQVGAKALAPSNGVILRWHVIEGTTAGEYHLQIATPFGGPIFQFVASSAGVTSAATAGIQTFTPATPIPIAAGQAIGLEMSKTASVGLAEEIGTYANWEPPALDGTTKKATHVGESVAGFNAEMQPAPTIALLGATSGPTTGGRSVTITGTDFEGASAVSFGGVPATTFTVNSESQIAAVAPASASATSVPVTVTTIAGTATSAQTFTYVAHCVVPNLKGKKLKAAKKALAKAQCKLGKVRKLTGATAKEGKVTKQSRKAGTELKAGAKVAVTLKPPKHAAKKHHAKKHGKK